MTNAIAARANNPGGPVDAAGRHAPTRKAMGKPATGDDASDANAAFEQEISDATRSSDALGQSLVAMTPKAKSGDNGADTTRQNDTPAAGKDGVDGDKPDAPLPANDPLAGIWAGQIAQAMTAMSASADTNTAAATTTAERSRLAMTGAQVHILSEKSTSALLQARDRMMVGDHSADNETVTPAQKATPIIVNSSETHWLFASPANSENQSVAQLAGQIIPVPSGASPASASTPNSAVNMLASLLGGGNGNRIPAVVAAQESKQSDERDGNAAAPAKQKAEARPQLPADAVSPTQDAATNHNRGYGTPGRDQPLKPAVAVASPASAAPVEAASPVDDGPATPGASVVQQVRASIIDALRNNPSATNAASPAPAPVLDRPVVSAPMLRTIDVTLAPPDLGAVRLRLSLKSNALAIDAEASKASTAKLLNDDRDTLEKSLRTAGYDVSAIRVADTSNSSGAMLGGGSSFQDGSQARMNFAGRGQGDLDRRSGENAQQQDRRSPNEQRPSQPRTDLPSARQSNAVYI